MASFNSLPLELVERIIDLSAESDILLRQQRSRRTILSNLSLVSKRFTLPAQSALWKRLESDLFRCGQHYKPNILSWIEEGLAKTKAVEYFDFFFVNELEHDNMLWKIVNGVRQISSLELRGRLSRELDLSSLFLLPSLQNLVILDLAGLNFDTSKITFPSSIQEIHLTWTYSNSLQLNMIFEGLKDVPNVDISIKQSGIYDGPGRLGNYDILLRCFELHGYRIRTYEISHLNGGFMEVVLPYLPSLSSLFLEDGAPIQRQLDVISLLPHTVPLQILELLISSLEDYYVDSLLPLLQLSQLEGLKELYNYFPESYNYGERYERGGRERLNIEDLLREEMDRSVELCRKRGIALHFSSYANSFKYKVTQGMYTPEWGR